MLTQVARQIWLVTSLNAGRKYLALWESRQGGQTTINQQKTKLPWGGEYSYAAGYSIEQLVLERTARHDTLPAMIGLIEAAQVYNLLPVAVLEIEYEHGRKVREHRWTSCRLLSYSPGDSDIGKDDMLIERLQLQPHFYELVLYDEQGNERKVRQFPPVSPYYLD